ncbi:hypothetical protein [uncultured Gordonia sp.]|uniref:hypothetical protein n=1 Tax=uncultured Gordonia sp. TaxID=198437 RepID=UPI00258D81A0|nr:hypothetical protein [uncultured Gordonia sp.]
MIPNRRITALAVSAVAAVSLAGCTITTQSQPTPVRHTAPATVSVTPTPTVTTAEQQDRRYYACAAPEFGVNVPYDTAKSVAPDELAKVISAGRQLYAAYESLPAGTSIEVAASAADLDAQGAAVLRCAVDAYGGVGA